MLLISARVVPVDVSASAVPETLSTTFRWRFDENVRARIQHFDVEISPGTPKACTLQISSTEQVAILPGLGSAEEHTASVVAVYNDDVRAPSVAIKFTTPRKFY